MFRGKGWFSGGLWKPKNPHSLEHLKFLYQLLSKNQTVTEQNKGLLVETLRSIAEILIWGDQNDSTVFEFLYQLLSKNQTVTEQNKGLLVETLRSIAEILIWGDQNDSTVFEDSSLKTVLCQSIDPHFCHSTTANDVSANDKMHNSCLMCKFASASPVDDYLLSNNHVNSIIVHKFDFSDEEVMAYYISFLKTLSLKLNTHTIHFFYNEHTNDFPLYTEAIKFFNHGESMVRIAVRTLTLNVFKVDDKAMLKFIRDKTAAPYFSNLVWFIGNHVLELDSCVRKDADHQSYTRLADLVAEHLDHLHYLNDILCLQIEALNDVLTDHLLNRLLIPLYVYSLTKRRRHSQIVYYYFILQVFLIISHHPLVQQLAFIILNRTMTVFSSQKHELSSLKVKTNSEPEFSAPEETLEKSLETKIYSSHSLSAIASNENASVQEVTKSNSSTEVRKSDISAVESSEASDHRTPDEAAEQAVVDYPSDGTNITDEEKVEAAQRITQSQFEYIQQNFSLNERPFLEAIFNALECPENDHAALFGLCLFYALGHNSVGINQDLLDQVLMPTEKSETKQWYNINLVERLIKIINLSCQYKSRIRLATLQMSLLLLKQLVIKDGQSFLQDRHLAAIEQAREESTLLLRNFYKVLVRVKIKSRIRLATLQMSLLLLKQLVIKDGQSFLQDRHLAAIEQAREEKSRIRLATLQMSLLLLKQLVIKDGQSFLQDRHLAAIEQAREEKSRIRLATLQMSLLLLKQLVIKDGQSFLQDRHLAAIEQAREEKSRIRLATLQMSLLLLKQLVIKDGQSFLQDRHLAAIEQAREEKSRIRLATLQMSLLLLKQLVIKDGQSFLQDRHLAAIEQAREEKSRIRLATLQMSLLLLKQLVIKDGQSFLQDRHLAAIEQAREEKSRIRLATLQMSLLLLKQLVIKDGQSFLQDRHLAAIEQAREESTLLLRNFYKTTLGAHFPDNSDLIACAVIMKDGQKIRRFMVIDVLQLILVEPDGKRLGWGVAKFVGFLQDIEVTGDKDDSRCLHITVHRPASAAAGNNRSPLLTAKFLFDDHIRCMAAKQRLTKGRLKARQKKMYQIARLLDLPEHIQPCPSPLKCGFHSSRDHRDHSSALHRSQSQDTGLRGRTLCPSGSQGPYRPLFTSINKVPGFAKLKRESQSSETTTVERRRTNSSPLASSRNSHSRDSSPRQRANSSSEEIPLEDLSKNWSSRHNSPNLSRKSSSGLPQARINVPTDTSHHSPGNPVIVNSKDGLAISALDDSSHFSDKCTYPVTRSTGQTQTSRLPPGSAGIVLGTSIPLPPAETELSLDENLESPPSVCTKPCCATESSSNEEREHAANDSEENDVFCSTVEETAAEAGSSFEAQRRVANLRTQEISNQKTSGSPTKTKKSSSKTKHKDKKYHKKTNVQNV
ncbi:protein CLEC16A homolog [Centruroides sculpturatus]|uniref:protein CLEC16A homolog n=1 Tax=Centruroides sculpturatus TaxID=218467 RepID=UPI000C6D07E2|nr:protein CLEC16A homolog [Centruroides sculpturatus]